MPMGSLCGHVSLTGREVWKDKKNDISQIVGRHVNLQIVVRCPGD